jgi:urease accessory protein
MIRRFSFSVLVVAAMTLPAFAHPGHELGTGGLTIGFIHPFLGVDHILAMVAVGMWAVLLGGRAVWIVPTVFVLSMLVGFGSALAGINFPAVEPGIAASVIFLGFLIAAAIRLPLAPSVAIVGLFALFHGQAHRAELAGGAAAFGLGFTVATVLLHGAGITLGQALASPHRLMLARCLGGVTAAIGLVFLGSLA